MPRLRRHLLLAAAGALLAGCAGFVGPTTYTLSQADLQQLIERNFPLERPLLEVLEVSVEAPHVTLLPARNRIATDFDVDTRDRLFGKRWHGRLALESALRWEASDQTLRLQNVRVDDFTLDKAGSSERGQADRLGALLAERVLEDMVVYRLSDERRDKLQRLGLVPGGVEVTNAGVEIRFKPM
ncbi:MAG: DUF1439 domain-containing protein [Burkholderiales bacterium]|nr:DUF1439 domain-containing protein [Burkholderiales bacterium]MDE2452088.1 DUF1439 domain-containing protein [Burkholderiales bacterium]